MNFTEQQLTSWSKPVSTTEDNKCQNAVSTVTTALRAKFGSAVSIFLQGSYRNNTNVKKDSDVDIVLRFNNAFYPDLHFLSKADREAYNAQTIDSQYKFDQLKMDAESCLRQAFGSAVERKNKCIQIVGNTYRVTADVIPCFVLKRLQTVEKVSAEGIKFYSDKGEEVKSFPEQHYNNGVKKTERTHRLYKRIVRILKVVNNRMIDDGIISDQLATSFFIESLVYNVPDNQFEGSFTQATRNVIGTVYKDMENSVKYEEVSGLHWLFYEGSPRTRSNAMEFMQKCWDYLGY